MPGRKAWNSKQSKLGMVSKVPRRGQVYFCVNKTQKHVYENNT